MKIGKMSDSDPWIKIEQRAHLEKKSEHPALLLSESFEMKQSFVAKGNKDVQPTKRNKVIEIRKLGENIGNSNLFPIKPNQKRM